MVRLMLGRSGSGKTTRIMREIAKNADNKETAQILIVPEQASFNSERELCKTAGNRISLYAEVMTFKSLARRVFSEKGGLAVTPLDEGGRLLAMYMAMAQVKANENPHVFRNVKLRPELTKKLVQTISEFKSYGIKPEDLLLLQGGYGILPEKLEDLSYIYNAYDAVMTGDLKDPEDIMALLCEKLENGEYFHGRRVYLDGFNGFTPAEMDIVSTMAAGAKELTISLCADKHSAAQDVFEHVYNTINDITKMCVKIGAAYHIDDSELRSKRFVSPASDLSRLEQNLFDYQADCVLSEPDGSVVIFSAPGMYEECEVVAAQIIKLVSEENMRYRDIAVTVRDLDSYAPDIYSVFRKYGLPVYLDKKDSIAQKTPVIALCAALDACLNGYRCEDVLRLGKTGLAGISIEEADKLENYALTWNINSKNWTKPEGFSAHPDGFGADYDDRSDVLLAELNDIRRRLITPLENLKRNVQNKSAKELAKAVFEYLTAAGMPDMLEKKAAELENAGKSRQSAQYAQLWDIICRALDQCVLILGQVAIPFSEFVPLFKLVLCSYDVGSIPTALDSVIVGEAGRIRFFRPKVLFVLGVSDGVFPAGPAENGVLTSFEKNRMLKEANLKLALEDEQILREQLNVYQTLSAPSKRLCLSFPERGRRGEAHAPSYIIARLLKLFPNIKIQNYCESDYKTYALLPCIEFACAYSGSGTDKTRSAAYKAVYQTEIGKQIISRAERANKGFRGPIQSREIISGLYGGEVTVTASRVEKFNSCKFSFFSQYGLRAKTRKRAEFEAAETGSFIHYVLEKTAADIAATPYENPWREITKDKVWEIAALHIEQYAKSVLGGLEDKSSRFVYLFKRLKSQIFALLESMVDEFSVSRFKPIFFEKDISGAYFELDGQKIQLSGRIDRVDIWESEGKKYLRVVDYKTGNTNFNYGDVEYGLGIQLLLYMFALAAQDVSIVPAGVLYIPALSKTIRVDCGRTREKILEDAKRSAKRSGLLLGDLDVLFAMEDIPEGGKARFIPVAVSGKEEQRRLSKDNRYVVSKQHFEIIKKHVGQLLKSMVDQVESGEIECNPYTKGQISACDRCDFLPICQFDINSGKDKFRQLISMKREEFFERKEKGGVSDDLDQ